MGWIDRTTKKRIAELDEHPELNSHDFAKKHNEIMKNIKKSVAYVYASNRRIL